MQQEWQTYVQFKADHPAVRQAAPTHPHYDPDTGPLPGGFSPMREHENLMRHFGLALGFSLHEVVMLEAGGLLEYETQAGGSVWVGSKHMGKEGLLAALEEASQLDPGEAELAMAAYRRLTE